ncbi:MAG: hypothetical protein JWP27_376 [Flaviaesturariibacter sp.]|nr:hypothetical protein [Flaviaesturariibacter sp.]
MGKRKNKVLVITTWPFNDGLILSYVLPYVMMTRQQLNPDDEIYIVSQEHDLKRLEAEQVKTLLADLAMQNIFLKPEVYARLGIRKYLKFPLEIIKYTWFILSKGITVIHTHAMGAGMQGTILSWLTGRPLVGDSYEPLAESMIESGTWKRDSLPYKTMLFFEKKLTKRARHLIACTPAMKDYAAGTYGITLRDLKWKPACVNLDLFRYDAAVARAVRAELGFTNSIVGIYVGKFGSQYLDREIFDFFRVCREFWGDRFRILILSSHTEAEIETYCREAGISSALITKKFVPHNEVNRYMMAADFAITPVKPIPSKRYCTPMKDGEYWGIGLPVVITENISDDSDIIEKERIGAVLRRFDVAGYTEAVRTIDGLLAEGEELRKRVRACAERYRSYTIAEKVYKDIYSTLKAG